MPISEDHPIVTILEPKNSLWKYMDIPSFISLLQERQLVFTKAVLFEDKYEGTLTVPTKNSLIRSLNTMLPKTQLTHSAISEIFETAKNDSYASCWINADHEIVHMWKIYAKETGIAIKTNYEKIKEAFTIETNETILPTKIHYLNFDNESINLYGNALTALTTKKEEYKYENEVRFIVPYPRCIEDMIKNSTPESSAEKTNETRREFYDKVPIIKCKIKLDFIDEIKLSPYAPKWYLPIIQELLIKYDCNWLTITQSEL